MTELQKQASEVRQTAFRLMHDVGGGHYGGNLSEIEALTVLYGNIMNVRGEDPDWDERDRFVMSKGHGGFGLYATLAYYGFVDYDVVANDDEFGVMVPKHASTEVPGVEVCTGSLGQGLSIANGIALGLRADGSSSRVYALLGDGECNEGQIWEAAMTSAKYNLDSLIIVIDNNHYEFDGPTSEVMPIEPIEDKWKAFGWKTFRVDGHDTSELVEALNEAKKVKGCPSVVIADTVKGKGISYMENVTTWHAGSVTQEQYEQGMKELEV
ncbi:MAG: transketolase [Parasporobacterium sp.]|nr:transketolase [Parasporobacterium sp.]